MRTLRAAVHVHSDWSFDGTMTLPRILGLLRRRGYDAVLTAEHCQSLDPDRWAEYRELCAQLSGPDLLVVPGVEYRDADNVVHVPTWGDVPWLGDRLDITAMLQQVAHHGGAAVLAHPGRRDAHQRCDRTWGPLLSGVEVWNRKYDGWTPGAEGVAIAERWARPAVASLDLHKRRQLFPLATTLRVDEPTPAGAVRALREGAFTAEFLRRDVATWRLGPAAAALRAADSGRRAAAAVLRRARII